MAVAGGRVDAMTMSECLDDSVRMLYALPKFLKLFN